MYERDYTDCGCGCGCVLLLAVSFWVLLGVTLYHGVMG